MGYLAGLDYFSFIEAFGTNAPLKILGLMLKVLEVHNCASTDTAACRQEHKNVLLLALSAVFFIEGDAQLE